MRIREEGAFERDAAGMTLREMLVYGGNKVGAHPEDVISLAWYDVWREPRQRAIPPTGEEPEWSGAWLDGSVYVTFTHWREGRLVVNGVKLLGYHSPSGFEMGYLGSGPQETALCILLHYFGVTPETAGRVLRGEKLADYDAPYVESVRKAFEYAGRLKSQRIATDRFHVTVTMNEIDQLLATGRLDGKSHLQNEHVRESNGDSQAGSDRAGL